MEKVNIVKKKTFILHFSIRIKILQWHKFSLPIFYITKAVYLFEYTLEPKQCILIMLGSKGSVLCISWINN